MKELERGTYAGQAPVYSVSSRARQLKEMTRSRAKRVEELPIVAEKQGILAFQNFKRLYTHDGALRMHTDPRTTKYGAFFRKKGRYFEERGRNGRPSYIMRGSRYAISLDPTADYKEKVSILAGDYIDALNELSGKDRLNGDRQNFIVQQALLDTIKNSAVSLFNALIADERAGELRLGVKLYQELRASMQLVTERAVTAQYAHMLGTSAQEQVRRMTLDIETIKKTALYLKRLRIQHAAASSALYARELNHPLAIGASALFTAELGYRHIPDVIIGLATGGTEYAFALQHAFHKMTGKKPRVVCLALSLHSKPKEDAQARLDAGLGDQATLDFLRANKVKLDSHTNVMIADDNAATGETIETLIRTISHNFSVSSEDIEVSVAQANPTRMLAHADKEEREQGTDEALVDIALPTVFGNSASRAIEVGGKPVFEKKNLRRIKQERKQDAETQTKSLALRFARKARQHAIEKRNIIDRYLTRIKREGKEMATSKIMFDFDLKRNGQIYSHTFLSNFYALANPMVYGIPTLINEETQEIEERSSPRKFPTSEHAYQCAKFLPRTLGKIAQSQSLREQVLKALQDYYISKNMEMPVITADSLSPQSEKFLFSDPSITPSDIKKIARVLSNLGYERNDWYETRLTIMAELLIKKFEDPTLKELLLDTGDALLVEFNEHFDSYFGVVESKGRFVGSNLLGFLLMEVREYYRNGTRAKNGAK